MFSVIIFCMCTRTWCNHVFSLVYQISEHKFSLESLSGLRAAVTLITITTVGSQAKVCLMSLQMLASLIPLLLWCYGLPVQFKTGCHV